MIINHHLHYEQHITVVSKIATGVLNAKITGYKKGIITDRRESLGKSQS